MLISQSNSSDDATYYGKSYFGSTNRLQFETWGFYMKDYLQTSGMYTISLDPTDCTPIGETFVGKSTAGNITRKYSWNNFQFTFVCLLVCFLEHLAIHSSPFRFFPIWINHVNVSVSRCIQNSWWPCILVFL